MIRIAELEFDDYNIEKLFQHGVAPQEVVQILDNRFTVRRNKSRGKGERQLIGETNGGRLLTIIIASTRVPDRWRPLTGWDSTSAERRALE